MKLGLLGGTFDPIHFGHLRAAENAREALKLEAVLFVPARVPPHRPEARTSALDRYAMVALAAAGHPLFFPSDLELQREGPSYTVDTLAALKGARPQDELVLIVGSDTFPEMASWREHARLLSLCTVAVAPRPGSVAPEADAVLVDGPSLPITASDVRQRVAEGRSIRYLVPEAVAEYIAKRGLYR